VALALCQVMSVTNPALTRKTAANANVDTDTIEGTAPIHTAAAKQSATNTKLDRRTDGAIRRVKNTPCESDISIRTEVNCASKDNAYFSEGWRLMRAGRLRKEPPVYHTNKRAP
jgi:hypothetical protein